MITLVKGLHPDARLPGYGYPGDAGMDLAIVGDHRINPGESRDLPTGIAIQMPAGHWGRITGRSSTLRKKGLFINEGVIDEGYRGELLVYVTNRNGLPVEVQSGERLAQLILQPIAQAPAAWAAELSETDRGTNGFGSTDYKVEILTVPAAARIEQVEGLIQNAGSGPVGPAPTVYPGRLYLGGAVDIKQPGVDNHGWRHERFDFIRTYCPICECEHLTEAASIVERNRRALIEATDALFVLDAATIGTPIEAYWRLTSAGGGVVVYAGPSSVFVEWFQSFPNVQVVPSLEDARETLLQRARRRLGPGVSVGT